MLAATYMLNTCSTCCWAVVWGGRGKHYMGCDACWNSVVTSRAFARRNFCRPTFFDVLYHVSCFWGVGGKGYWTRVTPFYGVYSKRDHVTCGSIALLSSAFGLSLYLAVFEYLAVFVGRVDYCLISCVFGCFCHWHILLLEFKLACATDASYTQMCRGNGFPRAGVTWLRLHVSLSLVLWWAMTGVGPSWQFVSETSPHVIVGLALPSEFSCGLPWWWGSVKKCGTCRVDGWIRCWQPSHEAYVNIGLLIGWVSARMFHQLDEPQGWGTCDADGYQWSSCFEAILNLHRIEYLTRGLLTY